MTAASDDGICVPADLLISFATGEPLAERAVTGEQIQVSSDVLPLLAVCRTGMTPGQLAAELASRGYSVTVPEVSSALATLVSAGVLEHQRPAGSQDLATTLARDQTWGNWWDPAAYRFHWGTRYQLDPQRPLPDGDPPDAAVVPVFQRYRDAPVIALPGPGPLPAVEFGQVLTRRRTTRAFTAAPLDAALVSQLLYHTHFPHHLVHTAPYGWLPRRAYAGGGARGELELYVLARNVTGLDPGLYHYQVDRHQLELLGPDIEDSALTALAVGQEMCAAAPVTVFVTAVPARCAAKYRTARAMRVIYADTGCLLQTFGMVATALDLGAYATAAFCDRDAEQLLGLNGVRETPLLILGAGVPAEPVAGEPTMRCSPHAPLPGHLFDDVGQPSQRGR